MKQVEMHGQSIFKKACVGIVLLALCGMGFGMARGQQGGTQSNVLVLRGGRLIDGTGRAPLEKSVVVIEGAKITSVGEEGKVTIPAGAKIINTTGKTVIPGLVDAHIHLYGDNFLPLFLYWGVTTVGDLMNMPSWILAEKKIEETGDQPAPTILTVLGSLENPPRVYHNENTRIINDEKSMEAAILEEKRDGADGIKFFTGFSPALMKFGIELAHREGLPTFAHYSQRTSGKGTDDIIDTGLDVHVHTNGIEKATVSPAVRAKILEGNIPYPEYLMDPSTFPALAQKMVDRKMALNPTLSFPWGKFSKHREEFDRELTVFLQGPLGYLLLSPLSEDQRHLFTDKFQAFDGNPGYKGESLEQIEEGYHKMDQFIKVFVDKGGKIIGAPDIGGGPNVGWNTPGISLHFEMQMLQEAGLTPMQILQADTLSAMEMWRKQQDAGSVEVGKRADLVVLNRNPLDDITATRDINAVIKSGQIVDREALANWKIRIPRLCNSPYGDLAAACPNPPLKLTSLAFNDSSALPQKYSCAGEPNLSPPLQWTNAPEGTASFALVLHDMDSPRGRDNDKYESGKGIDDVLHWMVWNIPGNATEVPVGAGLPALTSQLPDGTQNGRNYTGNFGYQAPCAGQGPPHHYTFELYALDRRLTLAPEASRTDLLKAMDGHILGHAILVSLFNR